MASGPVTMPRSHQRLKQLDNLGMQRLKVSCDPFHQQFVDISHVQRLVRVARDLLGPERVLVRWEDYLQANDLPLQAPRPTTHSISIRPAADHPCRFTGRAADDLIDQPQTHRLGELRTACCVQSFLGPRGSILTPSAMSLAGHAAGSLWAISPIKPSKSFGVTLAPSYTP